MASYFVARKPCFLKGGVRMRKPSDEVILAVIKAVTDVALALIKSRK